MIYVEHNVNKTKRAREPINMKNEIDILLLLVLMLLNGDLKFLKIKIIHYKLI